jgi:cytochrome P450
LPAWLQAQAWIERPVEFWQQCAADFGDVFTVQLGSVGPTVLFHHPEAVRQIFQLPAGRFTCRQFNEQYAYVMGNRSLLVSDGAAHRRLRRVVLPALQRQREAAHAPLVQRAARQAVETWPAAEAFNVRPSLHVLSLQVMLGVLFGTAEDELGQEITRLFASEVFQDWGTWSPWARFGRLQPQLRDLLSRAAGRRPGSAAKGLSLFDALLAARDENGQPLSEEEVQDQVFTMLIAGVDPAAIALTWALYWIHEEPAVRATLVEEVKALGPNPEAARLAQLPYLAAVCAESLRMYPVVATPSGRRLTAPAEIAGRRFDAGITLLPCTYLVHRREELYPEADRFRPERFLQRAFAPHEYFPFGGGGRLCVGAWLASLEMRIAVATILACRALEPAHLGPVRPVRHGTLLAPSREMRLTLTRPSRLAAG